MDDPSVTGDREVQGLINEGADRSGQGTRYGINTANSDVSLSYDEIED